MVMVSRRKMLAGSGLAATMVVGPAWANPAPSQALLKLPEGSWSLARLIERQLADGKFVNVSRRWNVQFLQRDRNIDVVGEQVDVKVEAPAALAQLAQLEEARDTSGLFPIVLTGQGLIDTAGSSDAASDVAQAASVAQGLLAKMGASKSQQDGAAQFLSQLQNAAHPLLDSLPPDLFRPNGEKLEVVEAVGLPDGTQGEFTLDYLGTAQAGSGWLDTAQRIITTRIGSSSRISRETWSLKPSSA